MGLSDDFKVLLDVVRRSAKVTRCEIAQVSGVNRVRVGKIFKGDVEPTVGELSKILQACRWELVIGAKPKLYDRASIK